MSLLIINCVPNTFSLRCSAREEDNDYRHILINLVEDLLATINLPEWPASQVLLSVLGAILISNLKKDSKESTVLKSLSIDILGVITAKIKQELNLAQTWMEILPKAHVSSLTSTLQGSF